MYFTKNDSEVKRNVLENNWDYFGLPNLFGWHFPLNVTDSTDMVFVRKTKNNQFFKLDDYYENFTGIVITKYEIMMLDPNSEFSEFDDGITIDYYINGKDDKFPVSKDFGYPTNFEYYVSPHITFGYSVNKKYFYWGNRDIDYLPWSFLYLEDELKMVSWGKSSTTGTEELILSKMKNQWCEENGINPLNISDQDEQLLKMKWG